ncbi:MAG: FAD-dependent oxidoreductase [Actinomycetota bacterium]
MAHVEVAVIGKGLIGTAATRHLAEAGRSVALIGPDEAADRRTFPGPFSSHGDEGRITRIGDSDVSWARWAARSIDRYADIERRSGIGFHHPVGVVVAWPGLEEWDAVGRAAGADMAAVDAAWVRRETGIVVPEGPIRFEQGPAGFINPRGLIAAQTMLASSAGAAVIADTATALTRSNGSWTVTTSATSVTADRVVVATGAFGRELLDEPVPATPFARTVALIEFTEPLPGRRATPALVLAAPETDRLDQMYWVPPVRYPDGRLRLKAGGTHVDDVPIEPGRLVEWFRSDGDPEEVEALVQSVRAALPDAAIASVRSAPCVTTRTATGYPLVEALDSGLVLALGGNGQAAKSSDELGRLAAELAVDEPVHT